MIDTQQVSAGYNGKQKRKTHVIFLHRVKFLGILFLPPQNFVSRFKVFLFFFFCGLNFLVGGFVFLEGSCIFLGGLSGCFQSKELFLTSSLT